MDHCQGSEEKKYILKLEAEALSFRALLSLLIEILDDVNNSEQVIENAGGFITMTSNGEKQKYHYNIDVVPWEVK